MINCDINGYISFIKLLNYIFEKLKVIRIIKYRYQFIFHHYRIHLLLITHYVNYYLNSSLYRNFRFIYHLWINRK
jgi:hypothetical protein